jgi:hypothetical protein
LVGVAVKVTEVPAHIAPEGTAAMLTLAGNEMLMFIIIWLEVAGEPVRHGEAFEVITTVIASPLIKAADV